jgi:hypothetical protein
LTTPDQRLSVPVVSGLAQPTFGIVSQHAPLGGAIRGATVGAIVEVTEPVFQHAERLSVILPAEDLAALRARACLEHPPKRP